jgi:O-antigen/teichoic acid export membrane protein
MWQLMAKGVIAVAGFTFWAIAARIHPQQIVGRGMGIYTFVTVLIFLTGAGLPLAVSRYARGEDSDSGTLFIWAVMATSVTSLLGALGAVVFARSFLLSKMGWLGWLPTVLILFVFVNGISVGALQEVRLIARRRPELVFVRALAIGILPLPALLLVRNNPEQGVWITGSLCGGIAFVVLAGMFIWRRELGPYRVFASPGSTSAAVRFALVSTGTHLTMFAPFFLLPFAVLTQTTGAEYAVFYFAWNVLSIVLLIPTTIAGVLLIEGGRSHSSLDQQTSMALLASIRATIFALVCLVPVGWMMALLLGPEYRSIIVLIPLLVASGIPWSISYVLISHSRIHEHTRVTWIISAVVFVGSLGSLIPLMAVWGTIGAALAWLLGNTLAAITAIVVTSWDGSGTMATLRGSIERVRNRPGASAAGVSEDGPVSAPVAQIEPGELLGQ